MVMVAADASVPASTLCIEKLNAHNPNVITTWQDRTPEILKPEEVYPLPWFLSPEWTKRSSPTETTRLCHPSTRNEPHSLCSSIFKCCFNSSTSNGSSECEMELGNFQQRQAHSIEAEDEAGSLKQCLQFLMGLLVIMAMALLLLIIFQPQSK
ncbi:hypothetical protein Plhal304r1_c049g0132001 [Plasmopara halstedii]